MKRSAKSVVITDLDDTLYDWTAIWYRTFSLLLRRLADESGVQEEQLIGEFRAAHQKAGTSEFGLAVLELPSLRGGGSTSEVVERFRGALEEAQLSRIGHLQLYPEVLSTLRRLKERGCLIVGYSESMEIYTVGRVKRLGLDGVIDVLYVARDHPIPDSLGAAERQLLLPVYDRLDVTQVKHLPPGVVRPNPAVLQTILREVGAQAGEAVYVGDSLSKDVAMAKSAGVTDVFARYGVALHRDDYQLLTRVTYWTAEEVEAETSLSPSELPVSFTLVTGLSELLDLFAFVAHGSSVATEGPVPTHVLEAWKTVVGVQQHFNDLEMQIRNFAITVTGAFLGLVVLSAKEGTYFTLAGLRITGSAALVLASLLTLGGFWFMDRHWYHRLLLGAVKQGGDIERRWGTVAPEIALGTAISRASPSSVPFIGREVHSTQKINIFYGVFALALGIVLLVLVLAAGTSGTASPSDTTPTATAQPGRSSIVVLTATPQPGPAA